MTVINQISKYIIPALFLLIFTYGYMKKVNVYDAFTSGAGEGLKITVNILPPMLGLMIGIQMMRASGAIELLAVGLKPILHWIGMPAEVLPLAILRPISGSASLGIVSDIIQTYGPDSYAGRLVSVMMGSTETTFYTVAIFYGSIGIKKIKQTLLCALIADFTAMVMSIIVCRLFF